MGVLALITVPAAIGFRRGGKPWAKLPGLASPTTKLSVPLLPPYQVSPATLVKGAVWLGFGPTCSVIFWQLASSPLVLAHSGRAAEVESTVSVARRAYTCPAPLQAPSQVAGMLGMLASSSSRLLRPTINIARASLVFSPPESVPLGWNTFSPLSPIMPRNERSWVSV